MSLDSYSSDRRIDYPTTESSGYNLRSRSYQSGSQSDYTTSNSDFSKTFTYDSRTSSTPTYDSRTPTYPTTLTRSLDRNSSSSRSARSWAPSPSSQSKSWTSSPSSKSWTSSPSSKSWTSSPSSLDSDQLYENEYRAVAANPPIILGTIVWSWLTVIFGGCTIMKHLSGCDTTCDFLMTPESLILMGLGFFLNVATLYKFPQWTTYQMKFTLASITVLFLIPICGLIVCCGLAFLTYLFPPEIPEGMVTY